MASSPSSQIAAGRIRERSWFFVWVAVAMLAVITLGFGKSFYARPAYTERPLPIHLIVHGVIMTSWYLLFLMQTNLVRLGRRDLHRKLGIAGVVLAAGVVVTGIDVHLGVIPRMQALGFISTPEDLSRGIGFALAGLSSLIPFAVLIALAVWLRRNPAAHKRLMYWAFVWTLGPAFTNTRPLGQFLDSLVAPHLPFFPADLLWFAALLAYDWKTLRRIHAVTWLGFLFLAIYYFVVTDWIVGMDALRDGLKAYVQAPA